MADLGRDISIGEKFRELIEREREDCFFVGHYCPTHGTITVSSAYPTMRLDAEDAAGSFEAMARYIREQVAKYKGKS